MDRFSEQTRACMQSLLQCHSLCLSTAMTRHLEETQYRHNLPQHLRLMLDCAAVCAVAADLMAHKSQFHTRFCALCAEVCETCAKDCEQIGFEECAKMCRATAMHCRETARPEHAQILEFASRLPPNP